MNLLIKPKLQNLICNKNYYPCLITCSSLLDATSRILAFVFIAVNVTLSNFNFHVPPTFFVPFFYSELEPQFVAIPVFICGRKCETIFADSGLWKSKLQQNFSAGFYVALLQNPKWFYRVYKIPV